MNREKIKTAMLIIAFVSLIRSVYLVCLCISFLIGYTESSKFILLILFVVFEEYCVFSCLLKRKNKLLIEIEFSLICFFYVFSIGYTSKNVVNMDLVFSAVYVVFLEIYKILYYKRLKLLTGSKNTANIQV